VRGGTESLIVGKVGSHDLIRSAALILKDDHSLYLVGGSLRDFVLGYEPLDLDFISRKPFKAARALAEKFGSDVVKLGKGKDIIYRIPLKDGSVDFSTFRETTIEENLKKRDFTINSLGVHLKTLSVFDPSSAVSDLENRVLRKGYERAFEDDPLRIVKAYRMKALYPALKWDAGTRASAAEESAQIGNVPPERTQAELAKILEGKWAGPAITMMAEDNVLFAVFPELRQLKGLEQSFPHKSDVLTHTLEMLDILDENLLHFSGSSIFHHSGSDLLKLRLAVLFHDAGKAKCFSREGKTVHFYGHQKESSLMAGICLKRLRFSNAVINDVVRLCGLHLRPVLLHQEGSPAAAAKRRLVRDAGENIHLLMLLSLLDVSSMDRSHEELESYWSFCQDIFDLVEREGKRILHPPKLINGLEAMKIIGLEAPGPELGKALIALLDAQTEGAVRTPKEAVNFLKEYRRKSLNNK
jgi:poly(A) polymerase